MYSRYFIIDEIHINNSFSIFSYDPFKCIILEQLKHIKHIQKCLYGKYYVYRPKIKYCELGDDLHMITCWLDVKWCLKMKDFIFSSNIRYDLKSTIDHTINIRQLMNGYSSPYVYMNICNYMFNTNSHVHSTLIKQSEWDLNQISWSNNLIEF